MHRRASPVPPPADLRLDRSGDLAGPSAQGLGMPPAVLDERQRAPGDDDRLAFELAHVLAPRDSARPSAADLYPHGRVQAELEVGSADDPLEREADQIAGALMDHAACYGAPPGGRDGSYCDRRT